ncbi:AraC family transcriptional regulator [Eubacteriales bacterium OttesenSCG-928-M02]|nr:AraC family transcriptional regulator [Eubacteriales bacterium OttesenSCG-928-M02]
MRVWEIVKELELDVLVEGDQDAQVMGGCCCDLLSWVMAHGVHNGIWITVQTHLNTIAVGTLLDLSCILVPEGIAVEEATLQKAKEEGICILSSKKTAFELCGLLYEKGIGAAERA